MTGGGGTGTVGNDDDERPIISCRTLWPLILERAHSKSAKIYDLMWRGAEDRGGKKCDFSIWSVISMGHSWRRIEKNIYRCCGNRETAAAMSITAAADPNCDDVGNNDALERKRKRTY